MFLGHCMLAVLLIACGGCSGGGGGSSPPAQNQTSSTVASILLTPSVASIPKNQQLQFTAKDASNNPIPEATLTWTSSEPTVVSISSTGLATGQSEGGTVITAASGSVISNPATLAVLASPTAASITVTPLTASIPAGQQQQFTARDAGGNPIPEATLTWTSSNQGVGTISSNGLAIGGSAGSTTITASAAGLTSNGAQLTVTAGGGGSNSYTTTFQQTENSISEGGRWLNGLADGLDWLNIRTASGVAYGTRTNQVGDAIDPTAILTGTWGWNQTAEATLFVGSVGANKEVEIRLNSSLLPHVCNGYEVLWEITGTITIVRWNGPVSNYTVLAASTNIPAITSIGGFKTGDVLKATNVSGTITAYVNGAQVAQVTDTTYQAGAPGFGLNTYGGDPTTYGLSSFTASSN